LRRFRLKGLLCSLLVLFFAAAALPAQETSERVRALEKKVEELERRLDRLSAGADTATRAEVEELRRQIDVLTKEIEDLKTAVPETAPPGPRGAFGLGPAASKIYGVTRGVSIGGYGEVLYQNFDERRDDSAASGRTDEIDLVRAVFYFGYKFDERFLFNSEIEYEHATTGSGSEAKGEVSVEFAYVDFLARKELGLRAGLVLLPVGFVNELHEPPVFLGARRPEVETRILPTTWRELGVGVFGDAGPVSYRAYVVNGLDAAGFSASTPIRGGRQKGSRARAEDFGVTGRLDFTGVPGLLVGVSGYAGDSAQGRLAAGRSFDAPVSVWDAHAEWRFRGLQLRGLAAFGRIGDAADVNVLRGATGNASVGERFQGSYAEGGFDVLSPRGGRASLVPFVRYERLDAQKRVPVGFARDRANDVRVWTVGANYRPIQQVVLKLDYQDFANDARTGVDQWNFALGWLF
jgi:uncharacterized coiled-coil protein SlyX